MANSRQPEIQPLFDPTHVGRSLDVTLPLYGRLLDGILAGEVTSDRKGQGMEYDGAREYVVGDNPRHIDARATARRGDSTKPPIIREYYADITPSLWIVTDTPMTNYRANGGLFSEQELGYSAIMTLLSAARKKNVPTTMVAANDFEILVDRRASSNRNRVLAVGHNLSGLAGYKLSLESSQQSPAIEKSLYLANVLNHVNRIAGRQAVKKSVVVVVSDFRYPFKPDEPETGWQKPLQVIRANQNKVIAIELINPWDLELPEAASRFKLGKSAVWLTDRQRKEYTQAATMQQAAIDKALYGAGITHLKLRAEEGQWFTSLKSQLTTATKSGRLKRLPS